MLASSSVHQEIAQSRVTAGSPACTSHLSMHVSKVTNLRGSHIQPKGYCTTGETDEEQENRGASIAAVESVRAVLSNDWLKLG